MKTILICVLTVFSTIDFSQAEADRIIGYYYLKDPDSKQGVQVYIYKNIEGNYDGKITWTEQPSENIGYIFLKDFKYNTEKDEWDKGLIYNPEKEKKYKSYLKFETPIRLKVRGFLGLSLLGQTMYWNKEETERK